MITIDEQDKGAQRIWLINYHNNPKFLNFMNWSAITG